MMQCAKHVAHEVTFEGYWNDKGEYWATEMAGVAEPRYSMALKELKK